MVVVVVVSVGLCKLMRECAGEGSCRGSKGGTDGDKRDKFYVKCSWSVHFSDQALYLISTICPILLLNPFLTICLHNLTPYPMLRGLSANQCSQLAWVGMGPAEWDLCSASVLAGPVNTEATAAASLSQEKAPGSWAPGWLVTVQKGYLGCRWLRRHLLVTSLTESLLFGRSASEE